MAHSALINEALLRIQEFVRLGSLVAAEAACREALLIAPAEAACWNTLAIVLNRQGRAPEAESCARQAVALDASNAEHWRSLGNSLYRQSHWADAAEAFQQSLARNPEDAATWNNLGAMAQRLDQPATAEEAYERCLTLAPGHLGAMSNLAYLLLHRGERQRAINLLSGVMAQAPQTADEWVLLGNAWEELRNVPQATAAYRRALTLAPRHSMARHKLAPLLEQQWLLGEGEATARQLTTYEPHSADAWNSLGRILEREGQIEQAIAAFQQSLTVAPQPEHRSSLLQCLQYVDNVVPEQLLDAHRHWEAAHARNLFSSKPRAPRSRPNRSLRLGLVSANLYRHPIAFLLLPALERLDSAKCVVVCYADQCKEDEFTARFRSAVSVWRTVHGLSADELATRIHDDEIDVLVDLMGHTSNRLLVFARKPAPVQVTWLGYVGTTGLTAMDYLLADRFHVRPEEEEYYTEKVLRMPHGYACYGPPEDAPEVGPLPALRNATEGVPYSAGRVTFGCFNNPAKFAPNILDAWAEILRRVPGARLLLKYGGLDDPQMQERLRGEFMRRGVEAGQIVLEGWSPHRELLTAYNRMDLALDTQPYSGGLTTCEALWMGVPVITFPGKTFAGRHSVSHLTNAGYPQFIAADSMGYVELAVQWAARLDELAVIRSQMREQVRQSPLCDAPRFARDLLAVLTEAWKARIASP